LKKILITGSNGLLGQKLVQLMSVAPYNQTSKLIATARGENRLQSVQNFTYIPMDITHREQVLRVIFEEKPDSIIHTAAMTQVDDCESQKELCWDLNVNAVKYLAEASKENNSFLVHLSTDFIFDGTAGPYTEEAEPNPLSYYAESKLESEKIVQSAGIRWAIARTILVYGIAEAMSRSNIILWVKKSLEEGKTIQVVDDQWRTPTLAEDLAMGCYLIAQKEAEGIFNISGYELLTPYDMAMQTADFFNLDKSLIVKTDASKFTQPAKRPPRTGFIIDKAREVLGYHPCSFKEGIAILNRQLNEKVS
jgi:dTDP-4-dehydrorhamnose reductase